MTTDAGDATEDLLSWRRRGRRGRVEGLDWLPRPSRPDPPALTLADRVRIARTAGAPQAVVRVLAYRRGRDAVRRTLGYVVGKAGGRFVVEGDLALTGRAALDGVVDDWSRDFTTRANGRDVVHLEMSAPPGTDRDPVAAAARRFAAETFGTERQYVLSDHRDTPHPHAHLVVRLRGHDGRQLDPRKRELAAWRQSFAAAARAEGLALEASPRVARGIVVGGVSQAVYKLRGRGRLLATDPVAPRLTAPQLRGEVEAFIDAASRLARAARHADEHEAAMLRAMADELARHAGALAAAHRGTAQGGAAREHHLARCDDLDLER